jgi:hypothetical protein
MPVVKAQKIPVIESEHSVEDELALFCYYFPQYTYRQAQGMPAIRIRQMIGAVEKQHARRMHDLVLIVAAPHSSKKGTIKNMLEYFKKLAE